MHSSEAEYTILPESQDKFPFLKGSPSCWVM